MFPLFFVTSLCLLTDHILLIQLKVKQWKAWSILKLGFFSLVGCLDGFFWQKIFQKISQTKKTAECSAFAERVWSAAHRRCICSEQCFSWQQYHLSDGNSAYKLFCLNKRRWSGSYISKPVNRFSIYFQLLFSSHLSLPEYMKYPPAGTLHEYVIDSKGQSYFF